jgi:hypothetical protein
MSKLYKCPYEKQVTCDLELPCKGCETFAKFLKAQVETPSVSDNEAQEKPCTHPGIFCFDGMSPVRCWKCDKMLRKQGD